jgi:hypothetical protein
MHYKVSIWYKIKKFFKQLFCRHITCGISCSDTTLKTCYRCGKELINRDINFDEGGNENENVY